MIFIDRQCSACNGNGCEQCQGTGTVGSCEEPGQSVPTPIPTEFGDGLRAWRLEHGKTFHELGAETDIPPSVLSEIEIGRREPTPEQRRVLEEIMR